MEHFASGAIWKQSRSWNIFFWLILVEYKSDFYGNHRFFQYGISHITPFILNRQVVLYQKNEDHRGKTEALLT